MFQFRICNKNYKIFCSYLYVKQKTPWQGFKIMQTLTHIHLSMSVFDFKLSWFHWGRWNRVRTGFSFRNCQNFPGLFCQKNYIFVIPLNWHTLQNCENTILFGFVQVVKSILDTWGFSVKYSTKLREKAKFSRKLLKHPSVFFL